MEDYPLPLPLSPLSLSPSRLSIPMSVLLFDACSRYLETSTASSAKFLYVHVKRLDRVAELPEVESWWGGWPGGGLSASPRLLFLRSRVPRSGGQVAREP